MVPDPERSRRRTRRLRGPRSFGWSTATAVDRSSSSSAGPTAYAGQMHLDHPELDMATLAADAVLAVEAFHQRLFSSG